VIAFCNALARRLMQRARPVSAQCRHPDPGKHSRMRAYLILTLERTGSNLLCRALQRIPGAGVPREWFGYAGLHAQAEFAGVASPASTPDAPVLTSLQEYIQAVSTLTSPDNVFGAKVHRYQFLRLERDGLAASPLDLLPFDSHQTARLVFLTRIDRQRQAVSTLLARRTGVYAVNHQGDPLPPKSTLPRLENEDDSPRALRKALDDILAEIVEHEQAWECWCETCGLPVLSVSYEALCADYAGTVADVYTHVTDVEVGRNAIPEQDLRIQRSEQTERLLRLWRG
jgi:LPS sulfotransferase NodH